MIRLYKLEKPNILVDHAEHWTAEILAKIAQGIKISVAVAQKYSHVQIKSVLLKETCEKCAYCESKVTHIAYGDVEHITAKATDPALAVVWENLTIACDRCNQNKSNADGIIDPYAEEPSDHFVFWGPLVKGRPNSEIGMLSERVLKLNRVELVEKRTERINFVLQMCALAERVDDPNLRIEILRDVNACLKTSEEYSAVVSHCLNTL